MENPNTSGPLVGYRVLDLAGPPGLHCTKLLADMGADIIKVEPPSGEESRRIPPFKDDIPHPEASLYFLHFNTNKRGITLDVETTDGRAILLELVRKADVVIETYSPERADKVGLSYAQLSAINPRLVVASITPFGRSGPWRDYKADDIAGIALGNLLYLAGERGKPPLQPAGELAYGMASAYGAFGVAVALYHRAASGRGQHIDVSTHECAAHIAGYYIPHYSATGAKPARARLGRSAVRRLCLANTITKFRVVELTTGAAGPTVGRVLCEFGAEVIRCETRLRGDGQRGEDPKLWNKKPDFIKLQRGKKSFIPIRLSETPGKVRGVAPLMGQHTYEIASDLLGLTDEEIRQLDEEKVLY